MKRNLIKALAPIISFGALSISTFSYDVMERYKVLEDKIKTQEMLSPFGNDFLFDISAIVNKNIFDVIDDAEAVSKTEGSVSDKIVAGQQFLNRYKNTEQTARINVNLGFPLPSFTIKKIKFRPNFRLNVNGGANIGIREEDFDLSKILDYIPAEIPQEMKTLIAQQPYVAGGDIVALALASNSLLLALAEAQGYTGKYFFPQDTSVPDIHTYLKADAKAGLLFNYTYDRHWYGYLNFYGLGRLDYKIRRSADSLARGADVIDFSKKNTTINGTIDYKLGYVNKNFTSYLVLEELKLAKFSDKKEEAGEVNYGFDPLLRWHSAFRIRFSLLKLKVFGGVHKRSGYGFSDGLYAGGEAGAHLFGDRLGLSFLGMLDNEHITLSPKMKLWFMQLQYSLKLPSKSEKNNVKISTLHSVDLRFFF